MKLQKNGPLKFAFMYGVKVTFVCLICVYTIK